jgi:hypothetical protein
MSIPTNQVRLLRLAVGGAFIAILAVMGAAAVSAASPAGTGDEAALAVCNATIPAASAYGSVTAVVRGETSNAALVANWQERRHPDRAGIVSAFRAAAPDSTVTVCLYSGKFVTPVGPPNPDGTPKPQHTLLRVLVSADFGVTLDAAGYPGRLSPETPSGLVIR